MSSKSNPFTVKWDIQNFSLLPKTDDRELLSSPWPITTTNSGIVEFKLGLRLSHTKIIFRLQQSVLIASGYEVYITSSSKKFQLEKESFPMISFSIEKAAIFEDSNDVTLLKDDTLKVVCEIWGKGIYDGEIYLHTLLQRVTFPWKIKNFNYDKTFIRFFKEKNDIFKVSIYTVEARFSRKINVYVEGLKNPRMVNDYYTIIDFELFSEPNVVEILSGDFIVPYNQNLTKSFTNLNNEFDTRILGLFQLQIECLFAINDRSSQPITSVESIKTTVPSKPNRDPAGTLTSDLLQLYKEKNFSDATLKTEGKSFQAHKNILSARSSVFKAMFENQETTEGRSGVVNIEDIDSDTVQRLVVFLYSESLDDMQWEAASKLYYAADKYDVQLLKQKCAGFLKAGLTVSNACDAVVLADRHSDDDLMKCAVDYIRDHQEVISSSDWESLEKCDPGLAAKILRQVFIQTRKK